MALLDERFLTVHPRTLLWWRQREQCRRCAHHRFVPLTKGAGHTATGGSEQCGASIKGTSCIEARDTTCGPGADLFKAAA